MARPPAKGRGRARPSVGRSPGDGLRPGFSNEEQLGLERIFARALRSAEKDLRRVSSGLDAEDFASSLWGIWYGRHLVGQDSEEVFGGGLIAHLAARRTPTALAVLRALLAIAPAPYAQRAARAADSLASSGLPEPRWGPELGTARPTGAFLLNDPVHDDAVSVFVGFDQAGSSHTVSVLIDFNLGGIAKDALLLPTALDEVEARARSPQAPGGVVAGITLADAGARVRAAFRETDRTWEPPVNDTFARFRAVTLARARLLPPGGRLPRRRNLSPKERDRLVAAFCTGDLTADLRTRLAPDDLEYLACMIAWFSLDYVVGTPLRFSPVMVEIFCCDWASYKIAAEADVLAALPDVLRAWIRFVGKRRKLPEEAIEESVAAVARWEDEMLTALGDPARWGPAKTLVAAMTERGIDPTDGDAVDAFIDEVNAAGGLDSLPVEPPPAPVVPLPHRPKRRR